MHGRCKEMEKVEQPAKQHTDITPDTGRQQRGGGLREGARAGQRWAEEGGWGHL